MLISKAPGYGIVFLLFPSARAADGIMCGYSAFIHRLSLLLSNLSSSEADKVWHL